MTMDRSQFLHLMRKTGIADRVRRDYSSLTGHRVTAFGYVVLPGTSAPEGYYLFTGREALIVARGGGMAGSALLQRSAAVSKLWETVETTTSFTSHGSVGKIIQAIEAGPPLTVSFEDGTKLRYYREGPIWSAV